MPKRKISLNTDRFYHIYNRSIGREPIFTSPNINSRALEVLNYYRFKNVPLPYSSFLRLSVSERQRVLKDLENGGEKIVDIICFCLMPNHYHLLTKQLEDKGILTFIGNVQNSFAKYYNTKTGRAGPLFESRFQAVLIESNEQLVHLSRYAHINPYTSKIVNSMKELLRYPWSSLPEYVNSTRGFCDPEPVMVNFSTPQKYEEFLTNRVDYQRHLKEIKDLLPK